MWDAMPKGERKPGRGASKARVPLPSNTRRRKGEKDPRAAFVHADATVIGMVTMGRGCSIWPGAVLRGDMNAIRLGDFVNVQDNCTLHTDSRSPIEIGDYSLIGHNAILHGCSIGRACLVGIGSIVLDGAQIGDGAMVTAGCLIRGRARIPSRALVVSEGGGLRIFPGKAPVRQTVAGSLEYVELIERYSKAVFQPFTPDEERAFLQEADRIVAELGLGPASHPSSA